ncbi:hypothetical protein [Chitinimonas sp.]|uniref:hypothetical protein n=1 Tax=Chitinimonas sp. TaxID=1934313 RepID=UPI002F92E04D
MRALPLALALLATGLGASTTVLAMQAAHGTMPADSSVHCAQFGPLLVANP